MTRNARAALTVLLLGACNPSGDETSSFAEENGGSSLDSTVPDTHADDAAAPDDAVDGDRAPDGRPDSEVIDADDGSSAQTDVGASGLVFPVLAGHADCDDSEGPSLARWVSWADAVAIGTVVELRPADGPWITSRGAQAVDDCELPGLQGVDLVLEEAEHLVGVGSDSLVIRIPAVYLDSWAVMPTVRDDVVEWIDDDRTSGLAPGMRVGGFLTSTEGVDALFPIAPFLWIDGEVVAVQRTLGTEDCPGSRPIDALGGMTPASAREALAVGELGSLRSEQEELMRFFHARTNYCNDTPPEPFPCRENDGRYYCPDDLVCDTRTMTCVEAD
jgi:hypothetical protein